MTVGLQIAAGGYSQSVPASWRYAVDATAVFALSLLLFGHDLSAPSAAYFDETWYVPSARSWLASNEMPLPEHPPLAKLLIAGGVAVFGDSPFGWRAASCLFGSLTVVGVWLWALALTHQRVRALFAAAVALVNGAVYVQARIAMLDIFLMAFCTFAAALFTFAMKAGTDSKGRVLGILAGVCLGLACACKLSGIFLLIGLAALVIFNSLLGQWRTRFEDARDTDFYTPQRANRFGSYWALVIFCAAPALAYLAAFAPQAAHQGNIWEIVDAHYRMAERLIGSMPSHPYMSRWPSWPALWRPVWYYFEAPQGADTWSAGQPARAVVALANPLVVAAGEIAIIIALWRWLACRELDSAIVSLACLGQYLPWALVHRDLQFSYYFFPSIIAFAPALAILRVPFGSRGNLFAALTFLALASGLFAYFLPILSAASGVSPEQFGGRIWLDSWR